MFHYFAIAAICSLIGTLALQWRLHVQTRDDRAFARYVFDHTRSTDAVNGFARLAGHRRGQKSEEEPPG